MRCLPLTVLVSEGPIARAYLACMRRADLRPERIVLLIRRRHPARRTMLGRWLPPSLRLAYAARYQERAYNFWPRRIAARHPDMVAVMTSALTPVCPDASEVVREMLTRFDYAQYADHVETFAVDDLRGDALIRRFDHGPETVLYTGGGIVPAGLLYVPGVRFLHVHPGLLPYVRGADGLLWSSLVRGRPGVSCFYMAEGIDTGDLISAREFPPYRVRIEGPRPDDRTLYRALFSFVDPLLRARLLIDVLESAPGDLSALPAEPQDTSVGVTYHFLGARLRKAALEHLFVDSARSAASQ